MESRYTTSTGPQFEPNEAANTPRFGAGRETKSVRKERVHRAERHSPYKPLVYAMLAVGVLFYSAQRSGLRHPRIAWSLIYHVCLLLLLWVNVLRFFTTYMLEEQFGPHLMGKVLLHAFVGKGAVFASACTFMSWRREKLWLVLWKYVDKYGKPDGANQVANKRAKIAVIVCAFIVAFAMSNYIYRSVEQPKDMQKIVQFSHFSHTESHLNIPFFLVVCICIFYVASVSSLALACLIVLTLDVRDLFRQLTSDLAKEVKAEEPFQGDLEYYRRRHEQICHIVDQVDEIFSFVTLSVYVTNIPMICMTLYILVINEWTPEGMGTLLLFNIPLVVYCFCETMALTTAGTLLNSAGLSCKPILRFMEMKGDFCNVHTAMQYFAFLGRLTEGHIGLTGWKLFYINRQTLKMVVFMIIGYAVIFLKFGNLEDSPSPEDVTAVMAQVNVSQA